MSVSRVRVPGMSAAQRTAKARAVRGLKGLDLPPEAWEAIGRLTRKNEGARNAATRGLIFAADYMDGIVTK